MTQLSKMAGFPVHEIFEDGKYIHDFNADELVNYTCANLNSWTPNRAYWERQYNYCNNLRIAMN